MGGKVALCVNQEVGNVALDLRCKGFSEGFGGKVTVLPVSNEPAEGERRSRRRSSPTPTSTRSSLSAPAPPASRRSRRSRTPESIGKINVATFDLSADFLKAVAADKPPSAIDQQQYLQGYLPVVFLANYAKYGLIPASNVASGPNLITKDKAAKVVELSAKGIR